MSSCSLADDLVTAETEAEQAAWQAGQPSAPQQVDATTAVRDGDEHSASPAETEAAAQPTDDRLLLANNDPLSLYLQRHRCISPDSMLAVSPPAASNGCAGDDADDTAAEGEEDEQEDLKDEAETSIFPSLELSPYEQYAASALLPRQLLTWLCTLLLPCSLLLPRLWSGLHSSGSLWAAALTRSQWRWLCERVEAARLSRHAPLPPLPLLQLTFSLLHLSLLLAATWLACAAVLFIAAVSRSLLLSPSLPASALLWSLLPAAVLVLLAINCWTAAEHLRLAAAFHSSSVSLLPLLAVFSLSNQLISKCLLRITEAETVSRGYYLPASAVSAVVGMDSRQEATRRQAAAVRQTAKSAVGRMLAALDSAQRQLLCPSELEASEESAEQRFSTTANVEEECAAPSIAELKLLRERILASQSAFLTLLTADRQQNDGVISSALLDRLVSVLTGCNHEMRCCLSLHSRCPPAALASTSVSSSSPSASSALSVVHHRIRSARARVLLLSHRSSPTDSRAVLADLHYIRAALQEANKVCEDMAAAEQQRTTAAQPQLPAEELHDLRKRQWREEEKEGEEAETQRSGGGSALLAELEMLRRRDGAAAALADGCGAVFEGVGQRRGQGDRDDDDDDEREDDGVQARQRRHRMHQSGKVAAVQSGPSLLSVSLSMVSELKSVLSHRPAVAFRSIPAE